MGLFSWFITKLGERAWKQFVEICKAAKSVLVEGWTSDWKSLEGLEKAWRDHIKKKAPCEAWTAFKKVLCLTFYLMLCVLLVALYATFGPKQAETPKQADGPMQPVYRYVAVVGARETIRLFLKPGAVFSLAHVEDAQPQNGEGICLGEPQRKWLDEFRKAIKNCIRERSSDKDSEPPVFQVTAYASIAPMRVGDDTSKSERLNCKVANWRAAAVGAYLINPNEKGPGTRWRCEDVKSAFNQNERNDDNQCGKHYEVPENQDGNPFRVEVHQWSMPNQMAKHKPVDDGERPSPRRYDVEIMNRVVRIEVPDDFCDDVAQEAAP